MRISSLSTCGLGGGAGRRRVRLPRSRYGRGAAFVRLHSPDRPETVGVLYTNTCTASGGDSAL